MVRSSKTLSRVGVIAAVGAVALVLSGCSGSTETGGSADAGGSQGSDTGVAFGAPAADWQAAFADVDPIQIRTNSSGAKGAASTADWEAFLESITEYSDGKITFDVGYSNAYAPATETIDALNDGRIDIAQVIPQYFPEDLPISAALVNTGILSNASSVFGTISANVWPIEAGFSGGQEEEFADEGMKLLVPYYNTGAGALICAQDHSDSADLKGTVVAASGAMQSKQVTALGASPTAMPFTEFYESLQRGAVGCAQTTGNAAMVAGLPEVAPHVIIDPEASFIPGAASIAFSDATWNDLPTVAQQLIWERTATFVAGNIVNVIGGYQRLNDAVSEHGGSIHPFGDGARKAMANARDGLLDEIAAASSQEFVDQARTSSTDWQKRVADAGFDVDLGYDELQAWLDDGNDEKIHTFISETVYTELFEPGRP